MGNNLGICNKSKFRIPCMDKLIDLGNVGPLNDFSAQALKYSKLLHDHNRCCPVRCSVGISNSKFQEVAGLDCHFPMHKVPIPAEQHDSTCGIGKTTARNSKSILNGRFRPQLISCKEYVKRCVLGDLCI